MPVRFAVASTNWSNTATWDNGAVPVAGDTVYPNGFIVPIDTDISVASLNNNAIPVYLPKMDIPAMTGNSQPSGIVDASNNNSSFFPYLVFDQNSSTFWYTSTINNGWVSYEYTSPKLIRRYYIKSTSNVTYSYPVAWNFEGWNGTSWDILEAKSAMGTAANSGYLSPILPNSTLYSKYRINILTVNNAGYPAGLHQFEMTESTATTYGTNSGGSFTVPASLSGTRNIVQTGEGIKSNNAATVMTLAHTSGNTVNLNVTSGGYIFNQNSFTSNSTTAIMVISSSGIVNFNSNIWGGQTNNIYNSAGIVAINNNSTVTVNGNIYASKGITSTTANSYVFAINGNSAILNVNGDVIGSNYIYQGYGIFIASACTVNVVGNLTSDLGTCISSVSIAGASIPWNTLSFVVNITGNITMTNTNSYPALWFNSHTHTLTINGSVINKGERNAIQSPKIRFSSTSTPYWIYQTNGASDITLAYGSSTGPYPAEADVKLGVAYAASPTRYGTCAVPLPTYVSQGVATGSTVGTAYINAADVWNVLTSTITTAGSIGERLKVASTVETTGDQLAAYIV
jgi:hypothetical protein